ncbi:unnamed protein product [Prorocentrum cordatum]|uniref:Uncharacterized protein n=1 Tax=Prorocentrum cordatum TaxID=2364126 RepID=A0ABN9SDL7_9DINO|nr:unnamed protein product [Polarella glacialis]
MTGERSTNNFGRRGEEEKEKEEETVPSLREGRGLAAFPGPASQRRAEISGNRLTIFLVRAHVAAPGDPWTRSPRDANHESPTNIHEASDPPPPASEKWKSPNGTALTTTPQQMTAARQNGPAK